MSTPFIALDGSCLVFERFVLWVSFRGESGVWSKPIKPGPEVNGPSIELCPVVRLIYIPRGLWKEMFFSILVSY